MALMSWNAFHEEHLRSFLVFADVESGQQRRFERLYSLAQTMDLGGAYALQPDKGFIRMAFARAVDATKFAGIVQATRTARENRWAGQWAFAFGGEMDAVIEALLPTATRHSSGTRSGRKFNRRALPF